MKEKEEMENSERKHAKLKVLLAVESYVQLEWEAMGEPLKVGRR